MFAENSLINNGEPLTQSNLNAYDGNGNGTGFNDSFASLHDEMNSIPPPLLLRPPHVRGFEYQQGWNQHGYV